MFSFLAHRVYFYQPCSSFRDIVLAGIPGFQEQDSLDQPQDLGCRPGALSSARRIPIRGAYSLTEQEATFPLMASLGEMDTVVRSRDKGPRANVFIRIRPCDRETEPVVWKTHQSVAVDRGTVIEEFPFSRVFTEDNLSVFHAINDYSMNMRNKCLVDSLFQGANETLFAYGQTGSGKTHTIFGETTKRPGLLHMFIQDLFAVKYERRHAAKVDISLRCFEIFGESLVDLIDENMGPETEIFLKTARFRFQTVRVDTVHQCLEMLRTAEEARTIGESSCNNRSSRSHCVVQFEVTELQNANPEAYTKGTLTFVDLAGSERANVDTRACNSLSMRSLNSSLASLVRLLRQLQRGELHESERRQSVLNKLVFDYVQPTCGIWLIFCISQLKEHREHTVSTLQLATDSRNIRLAPQKHTFMKYEGELVPINHISDPYGQQRRENLQIAIGMGPSAPQGYRDHLQLSDSCRLADDVLCESLLDDLDQDGSTTVPSDDLNHQVVDYHQAFNHLRRKYDQMVRKKTESIDTLVDQNKGLQQEMNAVLHKLHSLERLIYTEKEFMVRTLEQIQDLDQWTGPLRNDSMSRSIAADTLERERVELPLYDHGYQYINEHGVVWDNASDTACSTKLMRSSASRSYASSENGACGGGRRSGCREQEQHQLTPHKVSRPRGDRPVMCRPNACAFPDPLH